MARVTFLPSGITAEFEPTSLPHRGHGRPGSLLAVALNFGVPLPHDGEECGSISCRVDVVAGEENLSPLDETEQYRLSGATGPGRHSRLACRAVVTGGEVTVEIPG